MQSIKLILPASLNGGAEFILDFLGKFLAEHDHVLFLGKQLERVLPNINKI
jgi:hypothetical protein